MIERPTAFIDVSQGLITIAKIVADDLPRPLSIDGEDYLFIAEPSKLEKTLQAVLDSVGMHFNSPIEEVSLLMACWAAETEKLQTTFRELGVQPHAIDRAHMLSRAVQAFEPSLGGRVCVWSLDADGCRVLITDHESYELHGPCGDFRAECLISRAWLAGGRELLVTGREVHVSTDGLRKTERLSRERVWQTIFMTASTSALEVYRDAVQLPAFLVDGLAVGDGIDSAKGCRRILSARDCPVARGFCWNPILVYDADDNSLLVMLDNGEHILGSASAGRSPGALDLGRDGTISREHACLQVSPGGVTIIRLSEKKPVWVDDLELGPGQSCSVSAEQSIMVGSRMLYYRRLK